MKRADSRAQMNRQRTARVAEAQHGCARMTLPPSATSLEHVASEPQDAEVGSVVFFSLFRRRLDREGEVELLRSPRKRQLED